MKESFGEKNIEGRESSVFRVVGGTLEDERIALEYFESILEEQPFGSFGKEKTKEEVEFLELLNERMKEFIQDNGGYPIDINNKAVHIIDENRLDNEWGTELERRHFTAGFSPDKQGIGIRILPNEDSPKLLLALRAVHEMLHFSSFFSFTKTNGEEGAKYRLRRGGLGVVVKSEEGERKYEKFFEGVDEAVITELTKRFDKKYFDKFPYLQDELEARRKYIADANILESFKDDVASYNFYEDKQGNKRVSLISHTYDEIRSELWNTINEIYENNKDKFSSPEDIFKVFTNAVLTGRLLPLARLIEGTYGKGSFRKMGELTKAK